MIAAVAALLVAIAPGPELQAGAARYRVEVGGGAVGVAELSLTCPAARSHCALVWRTRLRLPVDAGGGVRERHIDVALNALGDVALDALGGTLHAGVAVDGAPAFVPRIPPGCYPASAAELVLSGSPAGRCVAVMDEETERIGRACLVAIAADGVRRMTVLGVEERVRPGADGFPERVDIPAQGVAYVRDVAAEVPARVPLAVRVGGPAELGSAARFCGQELDPAPPALDAGALPAVRPDGRSCQVQAAAYAAAARRRGLTARIAVGVAHDGAGFVWHAWTEVRAAGGWVAVDPAFGQLPAAGPRFTVARHGGDRASTQASGRRILACWGGRVE